MSRGRPPRRANPGQAGSLRIRRIRRKKARADVPEEPRMSTSSFAPTEPKNGFLLVDKPGGISSFDVVSQVRRRLGVRQVGHTGTLDPLASGLLPILVGEATKPTPHLMGLDKLYDA